MKRSDGCALHGMATGDRARERDEVDARIANRALRVLVTHVQSLEYAVRQARFLQRLCETLGAQRRLRRMLENDSVAGHQCRHDAVHRDEIRIVPGGDRQHDAERLAANEAREVFFRTGVDVGERCRRDRDHVTRAFERAAHFVGRVAARPAHLPRQLVRDLVALRFERVAEAVEDAVHVRRWRRCARRAAQFARVRARGRSPPAWRAAARRRRCCRWGR